MVTGPVPRRYRPYRQDSPMVRSRLRRHGSRRARRSPASTPRARCRPWHAINFAGAARQFRGDGCRAQRPFHADARHRPECRGRALTAPLCRQCDFLHIYRTGFQMEQQPGGFRIGKAGEQGVGAQVVAQYAPIARRIMSRMKMCRARGRGCGDSAFEESMRRGAGSIAGAHRNGRSLSPGGELQKMLVDGCVGG